MQDNFRVCSKIVPLAFQERRFRDSATSPIPAIVPDGIGLHG